MGVMQGCCWVADSIVPIVSNALNFVKSVVCGHGRGKRLGTCLVCATIVVAFVACVNGCEFFVLYLVLLHQLCMGMDDASALVRALCLSCVHPMS